MARQKAASPYFKSVHSPPPSPTPNPISIRFSPRYARTDFINCEEMVNFSKLDTKALIEAATAPSMTQAGYQPNQPTPYALEEPQTFDTTSRKQTRNSKKTRLSDDSLFESGSSEDTFVARLNQKKQKRRVNDGSEDENVAHHPLRNKGKGRAFMLETSGNAGSEDDGASFQTVNTTKSKVDTTSRRASSSSRKAPMVPKLRKSLGTPVPSSLENAHPADKELFKMKADGKPWKEIKVVWERLMNKKIGDSTLSVRYCKMKENFEKSGGKDDMRILKFKAKVEAEFEADKWERVARMTEDGGGKAMTAREVRLRFKEIQRNGFQVIDANSDDGLPEVTDTDMDIIDRELVGVRGVDDSSLPDLEHNYVDEPMILEEHVGDEGTEAEERMGSTKWSSFGEAGRREDVEIANEAQLVDSAAIARNTYADP